MCLFGVIKLKFNIKPLFIPQNRQILAQNTLDLVFFRLKMLNNGGAQD